MPAIPHGILEKLRAALESRAETISSAAQLLLDRRLRGDAPEREDVAKIHQSALEMYRLVHRRITAPYFASVADAGEELRRIRHDVRNHLNNIAMRTQLLQEEAGETGEFAGDFQRILEEARACRAELDACRDFSAEVPDLQMHDATLEPSAPELTAAPQGNATTLPASILVADDNAQSREMLGRFLRADGHTVAFASTGREAMAAVRTGEFDLILLDLIMPEGNGFEVLDALRREGKLRHTPVILISGLDSVAHAIRGIELGADDYLTRPIDHKLLRARLRSCLERQRLRERELAQYFTPQLAKYLLRHPEELAAGKQVEVSVLFCDIVGFSRISEKAGPELTMRWLSQVLEAASACVMEEAGVLVDYTGDQLLAIWGAPLDQPDHADRACRAALAIMKSLGPLDAAWQKLLGQKTEVCIGINTGEAFVGNIGTPQKFKYGALGTTVNLASRTQGATKHLRSPVLMTGHTQERLTIEIPARRLGEVRVNNIEAPVQLFEIGSTDPAWLRLKEKYAEALESFENANFQKASAVLGDLLVEFPEDGPALLLMARVVREMFHANADHFEPVWELPGK